MKKKLFVTLFFLSILIIPYAEAKDWIIGIKNYTNKKMTFTVSYETPQGNRFTFDHHPVLAPKEHYEFRTYRGVRLRADSAKVEVKGEIQEFSLTGGHVERKWGNFDKGKYLKAKIKEKNGEIGVYIGIR